VFKQDVYKSVQSDANSVKILSRSQLKPNQIIAQLAIPSLVDPKRHAQVSRRLKKLNPFALDEKPFQRLG